MRARRTGELFVPNEHAYLPTDDDMLKMGVRSLSHLREIEGIKGPDYYTQYFEQEVEFVDGWRYRLTHAKIPREHQVTDIAAMMTTPWTVRRNGFIQHQMQTVSEFGEETTLASVPLNLNRGAGNYEANSRNYARVPRLSAMIMGEGERDENFGIVIGDSRGANYGEGMSAYGPEHGFDSMYNDLRVASQINGLPEMIELKEIYEGLAPEKVYEKIRNGAVPAHLNPITLGKLPFKIFVRAWKTFTPELTPVVNLVKDPVKMLASGESVGAAYAHTASKFRLETLDLPLTALRYYPSSLDINPRGAYRQAMEFVPLTDGSYGWTVRNVLRKFQFQYLSGRKDDGLSIFEDVEAAHDSTEFPHTITNTAEGTHKDILRKTDHTDRAQRLGGAIIPILAEYGDLLKSKPPVERSKLMHSLAAKALPDVFKGTESAIPEDYGTAA